MCGGRTPPGTPFTNARVKSDILELVALLALLVFRDGCVALYSIVLDGGILA